MHEISSNVPQVPKVATEESNLGGTKRSKVLAVIGSNAPVTIFFKSSPSTAGAMDGGGGYFKRVYHPLHCFRLYQ